MTAPLDVSVVIPAFNAATTIGHQLEALARQRTARAWEVVVADNGSADATVGVVRRFAATLPAARVIDASAKRGASAARNAGAAHARGRVLLFCDADDVASPEWIEHMAAALDTHAVVAGALDLVSLNAANRASVTWEASSRIRFAFWPEFWAAPSSNLGVQRAAFEDAGGFDVELSAGEDVDLCWRVQLRGGAFHHADAALMHVRRRDGLRALARQGYVWGSGERYLAAKYALFAEEYRRIHGADSDLTGARDGAPGHGGGTRARLSRLWRRLAGVRRLGDLADPVWRVTNTWGRRRAPLPPHLTALPLEYRSHP